MKGKIITLLFIFVWGLGACSDEEQIGPSGHDGEDITISASLVSADAVQTKADPLITDQEKTLNNTLVMVFKKSTEDDRIYVCKGWATGVGSAAVPVKTKIGFAKIIAIANIETELLNRLKAKYDAGTLTYGVMEAEFTTQQLTDPANLIKVGEKEVTLTYAEHNEKRLAIELIHLPARIDVEIKITDANGGKWEFVPATYQVEKIRSASDLILIPGNRLTNEQAAFATLANQSATNGISFYTYEKETQAEPVVVTISGTLKNLDKRTEESKTYRLPIDPVIGGASKTTGIAHGYAYLVTGTIDAKVPGVTIDIQVVPMQKMPVNVDYGTGETWK